MNNSIRILIDAVLFLIADKSSAFRKYALLQKENEILRRRLELSGKRVQFTDQDRSFIARLTLLDKRLLSKLTIVTPQTVLRYWQKKASRRWCSSPGHITGRPRVTKQIRNLVLEMKRRNHLWGYSRIAGECKAMNLTVSKDSVRRIIRSGWKNGDLVPSGSWKLFLQTHWDSLFACDFMTVKTLFGYRFYVFFLMRVKDRKIMQFGITKNPNMEFLKNQFRAFTYDQDREIHMIHDNSGEFRHFPYKDFGINSVRITPYSPDMNTYIERFHRSIRTECLDHFVIMNYRHLRNLVKGYVEFYNTLRPHQGLGNNRPDGTEPEWFREIKSKPVLFGLQHHFYRAA
ncbi:MAG: integrase core domain-containing protein [Spirochaetales bacterium]|nr:integrase core domain-containing protein [Spirochaetales bacterium]